MESKTFLNEDISFHCTFSNPADLTYLQNDNIKTKSVCFNDNSSTSFTCNLIFILYFNF
jgi:hypothetical protein